MDQTNSWTRPGSAVTLRYPENGTWGSLVSTVNLVNNWLHSGCKLVRKNSHYLEKWKGIWVDGERRGVLMCNHFGDEIEAGDEIEGGPTMADVSLVREQTALLMADFHADSMGVNPVVKERQTFERAGEVLLAARNGGLFVAYVVVNFRPNYPEVPDRNLSFRERKSSGLAPAADPAILIQPSVMPHLGEPIKLKHWVNDFFGRGHSILLSVIASEAKQSLFTLLRLPRSCGPRNDNRNTLLLWHRPGYDPTCPRY